MNESTFDPIAKVWSGPKKDIIFNDSLNLGFLMLNVIKTTPDRVIQVCDDSGAEMTCSEMYSRALKLANFLSLKVGLKHGDVVGIVANNSENITPIILACLTLGLPINPLPPSMNENDIIYMFSKTRPKLIFSDVEILETVQASVDKIGIKSSVIISIMKAVDGYQFVDAIIAVEDDKVVENFEFPSLNISSTPALIMCSSGTTSMVKGISKSHKELIHHLYPFYPIAFNEMEVCFYHTGPYWITSMIFMALSTLYGFKRVITSLKMTPEIFMDIIDRYKVTSTICAPFMGTQLLQSKKRRQMLSVRSVLVAGAVFTKDYIEEIQQIFPNAKIVRNYSMTEGFYLTLGWKNEKLSSSGTVASNMSLKIIDEDNNPLDANQLGQICFKTLVPFLGYYEEPEIYAEAVQPDGWILSGDLGYYDEEGHFFIIDRLKSMIKVSGIHFTSKEIENIINKIDGVDSCCVVSLVGVLNGNDAVFAFVIKSPSAFNLSEKKIEEIVHKQVIDAKKISGGVHFVDKFHRTASGKIKLEEMKKMAKETSGGREMHSQ